MSPLKFQKRPQTCSMFKITCSKIIYQMSGVSFPISLFYSIVKTFILILNPTSTHLFVLLFPLSGEPEVVTVKRVCGKQVHHVHAIVNYWSADLQTSASSPLNKTHWTQDVRSGLAFTLPRSQNIDSFFFSRPLWFVFFVFSFDSLPYGKSR